MNRKFGIIVTAAVIGLAVLNSAFFIVDQTKQAIVVQLGNPVGGVKGPGLHFKIPIIQEVIFFENRILNYDAAPAEILTEDKKNLVVDNYAKWRITNPLVFYKAVRNVGGALQRLDDIIFAELRVELGRHPMIQIISQKRSILMEAVTKRSDDKARAYGISVLDVRIKRADLPKENERAVFGRMRTERERQAKKYRSEGQEAALKLRSEADREKTVILAEAYRKSQELRGLGDAEATRVYAEAYNLDAEFFNFQRSLEAYRTSFDSGTTMILSPRDEFLQYMDNSQPQQ
ncbi:MAG: protease modulator HflC [Pseudomonadota bacterium]